MLDIAIRQVYRDSLLPYVDGVPRGRESVSSRGPVEYIGISQYKENFDTVELSDPE